MKYIALIGLLAVICSDVSAQNLSGSAPVNQLEVQEKQIRKIKQSNVKKVDQIMIDTLMDDGWNVQTYQDKVLQTRTAMKFTDFKAVSCFHEISKGKFSKMAVMPSLEYKLKQVESDVYLRVSISVSHCIELSDRSIRSKVYARLWESVGKSLFVDSADIDPNLMD